MLEPLQVKIALYATFAAALVATCVAIFQWGASSERELAARKTAIEASRIIKDKTRNDAEIGKLSEAELCRELNGGVKCE